MQKPKLQIKIKNSLIFLIFCLVIGIMGFNSSKVLAYDTLVGHPILTEQAINLYNLNNPKNKISYVETQWLKEGSIKEDTPPRFVNHFFDPIHNLAWIPDNTGNIDKNIVAYVAKTFFTNEKSLTSKDWSQNQKAQMKYVLYGGDQTFNRAIYEYVKGNKKKAFQALGYVLHLIEDATVPDHTRNDTHIPGNESPYEEWVKNYLLKNNINIANDLFKNHQSIYLADSLDKYFDLNALYSNQNFLARIL